MGVDQTGPDAEVSEIVLVRGEMVRIGDRGVAAGNDGSDETSCRADADRSIGEEGFGAGVEQADGVYDDVGVLSCRFNCRSCWLRSLCRSCQFRVASHPATN